MSCPYVFHHTGLGFLDYLDYLESNNALRPYKWTRPESLTTGEWLLAIAGHTSTLGSSHALLTVVSTSQALTLLPKPAQAATHATRNFSLTSLFVDPMDPTDVWYCRNLRAAICESVPVWRHAGRRQDTR